jgi:hypothetical protein
VIVSVSTTSEHISQPFWDGTAQGQFRVPECQACGHRFFGPEPACVRCQSRKLGWASLDGSGVVYSFTEVHVPPEPGYEVPYVLAVIELDDGPAVFSHLVGAAAANPRVGMRVTLAFRTGADGVALPVHVEASG